MAGWIALADRKTAHFAAQGLGAKPLAPDLIGPSDSDLLAVGSIVFEARPNPEGGPQTLFSVSRLEPIPTAITLQAIPGGGMTLVLAQGDEVRHCTINYAGDGRDDVLRITYAWDAPRGWGRFAIEWPESGKVIARPVDRPKPLMRADIDAMLRHQGRRELSDDVIYLAVSSRIEPLGPMPSLMPETPVATPTGYRAVGDLTRGDTVVDAAGRVHPVLANIRREVPARGRFCPVRLRSPFFGLRQDVIVAPEQRLQISGSEVEYLFGQEHVLIPARHLTGGQVARSEPHSTVVSYCQILLPEHAALDIAGAPLESLHIGRLCRSRDLLTASLLSQLDRSVLPEHDRAVFRILAPFEAVTLAGRRAA